MHDDRTAHLTVHKNGTISIRGLTVGDLRLLAHAIDAGAYLGGDRGGQVSDALIRAATIFRYPAVFGPLGSVEFTVGRPDPAELFLDTADTDRDAEP